VGSDPAFVDEGLTPVYLGKRMEKTEVLAIARAAGLDKAVREFRDDVIAAAAAAAHACNGYDAPDDPAAEPWPPMRVSPPPVGTIKPPSGERS
jgi:hypothetical protein